jgi:hypothetical protein
MFIEINYQVNTYLRPSKTGLLHNYKRKAGIITFRCDNCNDIFTRPKGNISSKRLSNNYFHVCSNCDCKKFAQRKKIERRSVWDKNSSSLEDISKL